MSFLKQAEHRDQGLKKYKPGYNINIYVIPTWFMSKKYTKHPEIKVGDKFYHLEVISPPFFETHSNGKKRKKLLCRCVCGIEKVFRYDSFVCKNEIDRAKSCGCKHTYRNNFNAQKRRKPESVYRYIYEQYQSGAKTRNINFNLTKEEYIEIVKKECFYCGDPAPIKQPHRGKNRYVGVPVPYNGIDRIDSMRGYEKENCVPCCTKCNYMKSDMNVSSFMEHILKIANHQKI